MKMFISNTPASQIVTATQEIVDGLLAMNTGNRNVRRSHVKWLSTQIKDGSFVLTNQGVGVDRDGKLIDGQHRLEALVDAGYPAVQLLVVYGLHPEACRAVDTGLNRTIADLMHFAFGKHDATSAMIACVRFWGVRKFLNSTRRRPTPYEVAEWYAALAPTMMDVIPAFNGERPPAPVLAAVCDAVLENGGDVRPILFITKTLSGVGLAADSPELRLAQYLSKAKGSGMKFQEERYRKTKFALEAAMSGRRVTRLGGFIRSGSVKQASPEEAVAA